MASAEAEAFVLITAELRRRITTTTSSPTSAAAAWIHISTSLTSTPSAFELLYQ
jgi:hypothetical protein